MLSSEDFAKVASGLAGLTLSPVHIIDPYSPLWSIDGPLPVASYPRLSTDEAEPGCPFRTLFDTFLGMAKANPLLISQSWTKVRAHAHFLHRGTRVHFHIDGHSAASFAFYAHGTWSPEWGGDMILPAPDGVCVAVSPLPNRCVMTAGTLLHGVSRVDPDAGSAVRASVVGFLIE